MNENLSEARISELLEHFTNPDASVAHLLCDGRPADATAFRIVASDLSWHDLTYGELRAESERLASSLALRGVNAGDRVAVLMRKSRSYVVTVMALWRIGAVLVPLFTAFAPSAVTARVKASYAKAVICDLSQRDKVEAGTVADGFPFLIVSGTSSDDTLCLEELIAEGEPGFPAALIGGGHPLIQLYTSGTTGTPKGVVAPTRALAAFQTYAEFGLGLTSDDVFWNAGDPGWAYGLYFGILGTLTTGFRGLLLESGFEPELTFAVLDRFGVTNFATAPTVFRALRSSGIQPPQGLMLRCASSAGEPLTPEVNDWAREALGVEVHDHYGQTELGMVINNHQHPALREPLKPGSMGRTMPGWRAEILKTDSDELAPAGEAGRVVLDVPASPLAWFEGYVDEPAKTAEKFSADRRWYITGDRGRRDADGSFYFLARDDDVIIMAGYRIGPFEIESVILAHPAIAECAVVAVPDEVRGEVLESVVVLRPGHAPSAKLTKEIQEQVKRGYAAHAYPRRVHYADTLPKTPSGKIQRFIIRQELRAQMQAQAGTEQA